MPETRKKSFLDYLAEKFNEWVEKKSERDSHAKSQSRNYGDDMADRYGKRSTTYHSGSKGGGP